MKDVIRNGVFETNSSSVHSITMCSDDMFKRWINNDGVYYDATWGCGELVEVNESIEKARQCNSWDEAYELYETDKNNEWYKNCYHRFLTYDEYNDYDYIEFETFAKEYTTESGEVIHAFGYYGHD